MTDLLQHAHDALVAHRAECQTRLAQVDAAIAGLQPLLGQPLTSSIPGLGMSPPAPRPRQAPPADPPARGTRASTPPTAISAEDLLRAVGERQPVSPRELAAHLSTTYAEIRYRLGTLTASGQIVASGTTRDRRLSLPAAPSVGRVPASSTPAPQDEAAIAAARDAAITARLQQGRATLEELIAVVPDVPGLTPEAKRHATMKAVRRLTLRRQIRDVGDRFALVA